MSDHLSDWEIAKLGDLATIKASNVDKKAKEGQKEVHLCNYMDVFKNPVVSSALEFMRSTASEKEISEFSLSRGDVLLTKDSEVPEEIGIPSVVTEDIPDLVCGYHLYMLRADHSRIHPAYLCWALRSNASRQYFYQMANGSTRFGLNLKHVEECPVAIPPLPEQKKIAEILSGIDKLISNNKTHIAKKEQLLAAVLSERFCEIRNQTESTPLGDCCTHILDFRGRTPAKLGMDWGGGTIRALSANNVRNGYIDFNRECYMGGEPLYERWMTRGDCKQGDIIFTMEAPMGNVAIIPNNEKYILSQRVVLISPERKSVLPEYMYWYMRSTYFRADCEHLATGTTAKGIKQANLITIEIPLPPMHAQEKVTSLANSLDTSLKIEKDLFSQLIMLKQSLSSDLLSGRKRVTP